MGRPTLALILGLSAGIFGTYLLLQRRKDADALVDRMSDQIRALGARVGAEA